MMRPYAAFNVLPTEIAESGRSRTKLLPAANAIADCFVLSVIANATVVWLEGERRTRSRIVLLRSPNLRSTTTVSNFRVFTRRMALGISVQTSVEAANSWRDLESCSIVGGSPETRSARTADSEEPRCRFMTRRHDCLVHYLSTGNFGEDFRDLLRKPNKAAAGFRQNRFSAR